MLRDKAGNKLFRRVEVRVLFPDNIFPPKTFVEKAGPHKGYSPDNIFEVQSKIADRLEELYPYWEFRVTELSPAGRTHRSVFNFAGYLAVPVDTPMQDLAHQIFNEKPQTADSSNLTPALTGQVIQRFDEAGSI